MRKEIGEALAAWRDAERQVENAVDGERDGLEADAELRRNTFQQLSAEHMVERMDALKEAEGRRKLAVPSTPPFHQAAKDEMVIAKDIWHSARQSDEDTPQHDM